MRRQYPLLMMAMMMVPGAGWCAFTSQNSGLFLEQAPPRAAAVDVTEREGVKKVDEKDPPIVFTADEVGYDQNSAIVIARGKVQIQQGEYVVFADQITYYQNKDTVVAEGNVSILQPTGDVFFSERAQLNNALKTGVIDAFKARLADNSVFVAERAVKVNPALTQLSSASYTPCNVCEEFAPFWQLNADDVQIDEKEERVTYHDATMEFGGVPVFYSPYLSHPTPDAQAKSGFLPPQYGRNSNLGSVVRVPYYWRIDHDKEAIITPWYTTQEGVLLQGGYRQLTNNGFYDFDGSASFPEQRDPAGNPVGGTDFRGHLFAKGIEQVTDITRVGFDIQRASDDTFLRRYSLGDQPTLFSRLFAEAAEGRNFASMQALSIQGLRATDDSRVTPYVLPWMQAYYESKPDEIGLKYHVSGDIQALGREQGISQRRVSVTTGASIPYVTDAGHIFTGTVNLRQDLYQTDNIVVNGTPIDNTNYRVLPQVALEWRLPLVNHIGRDSWTVEPLVLGVLQSNGGNPAGISNEDSKLLELTDTNLFSLNRMPGLDVIDNGPRVAYGARTQYLFSDGTSIDGLLGQNYNPNNTPFPNSITPGEDFSDFIGRIAYNVAPFVFSYRFAMDKEEYKTNRNELLFSFDRPWLYVATSYRSIDNNRFLTSSEEGAMFASLPVTDSWSVHGQARRNFTTDQFVNNGAGVMYKNECFNLTFDVQRSFTRDRDVEPTTAFLLRVAFKNLGEFGYGGINNTVQ